MGSCDLLCISNVDKDWGLHSKIDGVMGYRDQQEK
jgi:hypothetical protein